MSEFLGIVGSQEKDLAGKDISLEHYRRTGFVEVFCREALFADFSSGIGGPLRIRKGAQVWEGEMAGFRMGVLSGDFTPRNFFQDNAGKRVGIYMVRLWTESPVTDKIIGAKVYMMSVVH